jgi:CHAT domain-containing protein
MMEEARFASMKSRELAAEAYTARFPAEYWKLLAQYQRQQTAAFQKGASESAGLRELEARLANIETLSGLDIPQSTAAGTPRFGQWQARLPADEVVYAFQLAEPRSLLWVVRRDSITMHRIAGRGQLRKLVGAVRQQMTKTREGEPCAEAIALSREIFRDFPRLKGTIPVVTLVLDQELHDLPFAVLPSIMNEKHFLLRDALLRVAPSTAMPARAMTRGWNRRAVAMADAVYNRADARAKDVEKEAVLGLNRLPGSGREAATAMQTLAVQGWQTATYAGREANPEQLRRQLEESPDVLHVAAHFLRTQDKSAWLGLGLSPDGTRTSIFGLADMRRLKTDSRVVVLSGCETQGGAVFPGLGVNGLARNFLVAGAESVLVTLWPIEDSTGPLFPILYQHLVKQAPGPRALPAALRAAQIALLDSGQWTGRPDYWAAYVAITRG